MALFIYFIGLKVNWTDDPFIKRLLFLIIIIITEMLVYFLNCYMLKVKETVILKKLIFKVFKKFC